MSHIQGDAQIPPAPTSPLTIHLHITTLHFNTTSTIANLPPSQILAPQRHLLFHHLPPTHNPSRPPHHPSCTVVRQLKPQHSARQTYTHPASTPAVPPIAGRGPKVPVPSGHTTISRRDCGFEVMGQVDGYQGAAQRLQARIPRGCRWSGRWKIVFGWPQRHVQVPSLHGRDVCAARMRVRVRDRRVGRCRRERMVERSGIVGAWVGGWGLGGFDRGFGGW